jgi:GH25 family lysozyme M1 (1,4-beta-N-acetylmuramidase)
MLIDVSKWNGNINWTKAKAGGVDGVIIRCAVGTGTDTKFYSNIDGALAAGIKVGVYVYSKAKGADQAVSDAEHALTILKPYEGKLYYPVFIDSEENSTKSYAKTTCQAFINKINNDGRFRAGVYCSSSWFKSNIKSLSGNYTKWIAQWSSKQPSCDIWQYSSTGSVSGISGDVDLDKVISYNPEPTPTPTPPSGGIEVTTRVIYYRKGNLMKGQDVKSVQAIVGATQDGTCGAKTDKAIRAYQKAHGLKQDGMFGPACWQFACGAR